jgi:hypothetical protein
MKKEDVIRMSDKEILENCFQTTEQTQKYALVIEEMFNSKQTVVPEELKILSIQEISAIFMKAFINIIEKQPDRLKGAKGQNIETGSEFYEFNEFSKNVKRQLYCWDETTN